jgi:3-methyl-2-oxobutanoate hydroxymethyltransferase
MKQRGERIVALTAYDHTLSRLLDQSHVDLLLIGDSLGMVFQGHDTTLPVTLDEMIYHSRAVARGSTRAVLVADLPFGSFQESPVQAFRNAARLLQESGVQAVKLEGGLAMVETVRFLVERGIPVIGHIGLTPQSVHAFGGFRMQGREVEHQQRLLAEAQALDKAGVAALVLEGIPATLAAAITHSIATPTIGIGAGPDCTGQVLVIHDLLGLYEAFTPKFARRYLEGGSDIRRAVRQFAADVRNGSFPAREQGSTTPARAPIFTSTAELRQQVTAWKKSGLSVGFVPTMGALHAGHLSLVQAARQQVDRVVVSIFVNPTQFGAGEDFDRYPRDLDGDRVLLDAIGHDGLFAPDVADIYPSGAASCQTRINVDGISRDLCGACRPGHFQGVATVVALLFQIVQPDVAFFGQKDYQQLQVIRHMVRDLHMPIQIVGVPTVREPDGLAMSSRNRYLAPTERQQAQALFRALERGEQFYQAGCLDSKAVEAVARDLLLAAGITDIDYVSLRHPDTLEPVLSLDPAQPPVLLLAVRIGKTRLIDNRLFARVPA